MGGYSPNMGEGLEDYDFWLSFIEKDIGVYKIPKTLFFYNAPGGRRTISLLADSKIKFKMLERLYDNHTELYQANARFIFS